MTELTYEAIIDAVKKSLDYKPTDNPYVYSHADMHVAILAGREAERERIVKLIEDSDSACSDWAIALIKGEI